MRIAAARRRPAALVWTNAPKLVDAFDRGIPVVARGGRYLACPTPYNASGDWPRIRPSLMRKDPQI